jgi:hypothetical protein
MSDIAGVILALDEFSPRRFAWAGMAPATTQHRWPDGGFSTNRDGAQIETHRWSPSEPAVRSSNVR